MTTDQVLGSGTGAIIATGVTSSASTKLNVTSSWKVTPAPPMSLKALFSTKKLAVVLNEMGSPKTIGISNCPGPSGVKIVPGGNGTVKGQVLNIGLRQRRYSGSLRLRKSTAPHNYIRCP